MAAELTNIVKKYEDEIKAVLSAEKTIIEKTVALRLFARRIASGYSDLMHYDTIDDFFSDYKAGKYPVSKLEGEGVMVGDILFLKKCPMAPLLEDFKIDGSFPGYWSSLPQEFMADMKNEAILHPLCIVHQSFRDQLTKQIPKGISFLHSVAVACRSGSNGKVVYSNFGMQMAEATVEEIDTAIDGMACAFYVK